MHTYIHTYRQTTHTYIHTYTHTHTHTNTYRRIERQCHSRLHMGGPEFQSPVERHSTSSAPCNLWPFWQEYRARDLYVVSDTSTEPLFGSLGASQTTTVLIRQNRGMSAHTEYIVSLITLA